MKTTACVIILGCSLGFCAMGCRPGNFLKETVRPREDIRDVTFRVPAISSPACQTVLQTVLSRSGLVSAMRVDEVAGELTITYNSRYTAKKNIEYEIAAAGFDIDDTPGDPEARQTLPEACR
jgi:hypothetical protein